MERHDTHNLSISEGGEHTYIFSSTQSEYSYVVNENNVNNNKINGRKKAKNKKNKNNKLLGKKEKKLIENKIQNGNKEKIIYSNEENGKKLDNEEESLDEEDEEDSDENYNDSKQKNLNNLKNKKEIEDEKGKGKENNVNSQKNLIKLTVYDEKEKIRIHKKPICYFTKENKIILVNKYHYKEFFANLKDIEDTSSENETKEKNEEDKEKEKEELKKLQIKKEALKKIEEMKKKENEKKLVKKSSIKKKEIDIKNDNNNNKEEEKEELNEEFEENKIASNNLSQLDEKIKKNKGSKNKGGKKKIKIYKRHKHNNKSNPKDEQNKETKDEDKVNLDEKVPKNIKRVIDSNTLNEALKKNKRVLKFNKKKSILQNQEINKMINSNNDNNNLKTNKKTKSKKKKSLSITNTPKNNLGLKNNEPYISKKIKHSKKTKSKEINNSTNNDKNKIKNRKLNLTPINSKNKFPDIKNKDRLKIKSKEHKNKEIQSQNNVFQRNNNNIRIKSYKEMDKQSPRETKRKKNNLNNNISNGRSRKKEMEELAIKKANKTINYNNKSNNYDIKLLSERPFKKEKNKVKNKLSKMNLSNIDSKNNEYNVRNLKLSPGKRNKGKEELSKVNSMKIFGKLMKGIPAKNISISNGIIENGNNKVNNFKSYPIFKNHHFNKFKNKNYNILNSDIFQVKENFINLDKINGPKEYLKKINLLGLNRARSNIFFKKTTLNDFDLLKSNNNKSRKNSDIFIYTKHYGDHNKCPLCQSMEMKAKFTESQLGLHKKYCKHELEENKLNINMSVTKTNYFPAIKVIEEKKNNNDISFKRELSPINANKNNERYFQTTKEQFAYNILKNKGKIEKLGINDFPVLDKYFNS